MLSHVGQIQESLSPRFSTCFLVISEHLVFLCHWLSHLLHARKSSLALIFLSHFVALHLPGSSPSMDGCFLLFFSGLFTPWQIGKMYGFPSLINLLTVHLFPAHTVLHTFLLHAEHSKGLFVPTKGFSQTRQHSGPGFVSMSPESSSRWDTVSGSTVPPGKNTLLRSV